MCNFGCKQLQSSPNVGSFTFVGSKPTIGSGKLFSLVAYDDDNNEEQSKSAKVQFMITNKMKATLTEELGYLPEEVRCNHYPI